MLSLETSSAELRDAGKVFTNEHIKKHGKKHGKKTVSVNAKETFSLASLFG